MPVARLDALKCRQLAGTAMLLLRWRKALTIFASVISVAAMGFLLVQARKADVQIRPEHWELVAVSVMVWSLLAVLAAVRWHLIAKRLLADEVPAFKGLLRTLLIARFLGLFTSAALADLAGRFLLAARDTSRKKPLAVSIAADKGLDGLLAALLLPAGLLLLSGAESELVLISLTAGILLPSVACFFRTRLKTRLRQIPYGILWALTVVRTLLMSAATSAVAIAIGLEVNPLVFFVLLPIAQFVALAALTPGGWGLVEAGWVGLLALIGVDVNEAAAFALAQRAVQVIAFGIGAFIAFALLSPAVRPNVGDASSLARE